MLFSPFLLTFIHMVGITKIGNSLANEFGIFLVQFFFSSHSLLLYFITVFILSQYSHKILARKRNMRACKAIIFQEYFQKEIQVTYLVFS